MKVKDFQFLSRLDSGSTTFELDLINYFKINTSKNSEKVSEEIQKLINYEVKELTQSFIKVNGKKYLIEKDFLESSFEQYIRLDQLLAEDNNIENIHKLLAIYVRPKKIFKIEKYALERQEYIANEILEMNIEDAMSCLVFFYQLGINSLKNIQISYLNQMNHPMEMIQREKVSIKHKLMKLIGFGTGK